MLNKRQQAIVNAIEYERNAGRAVVEQFELTVQEYWTVDRRSCDNLSFFLNAAKRNPRLQKVAHKLLPLYAPVIIKHTASGYVVANRPDVSLKAKVKCKAAVAELIAQNLSSLLNHPSIKVEIEFQWTPQRAASFKSTVINLLSKGVSVAELKSLLDAAEREIKAKPSEGSAEPVALPVEPLMAVKSDAPVLSELDAELVAELKQALAG